ncbi:MAG: HEAT repeat domain-containing protein [Candidatus Eisenbacteria bacterium]|uniref:HEAT repeat domain-containing protein n=1 Tax=Eiseniibacteriota bacterium TaxID=2212470 RepID=A0A933SE84_UNCEI|nr:HEAT repeat domain-containing protein [Candidatus Eisenbacteria bacterium]
MVRASRIFGKDAPSVRPMRERAIEDLLGLLEYHAPLLLRCSAIEIWLRDELVVRGPGAEDGDGARVERRIPFLLYRDGVRAIHMEAGTTRTDAEALIDALVESANGRSEDADLVSRLWEAELTGLRIEIAPLETALVTNIEAATATRLSEAGGAPSDETQTDPFDDWSAPAPAATAEAEWAALAPGEDTAREAWRERWRAERARPRSERTAELLRAVHALDGGPEMREALAAMSTGWLAQAIETGRWQEALEAYATLPAPRDMSESIAQLLQNQLSGLDVESIAERLDESDAYTQGTFFALTVQIGVPALDLVVAVLGQATRPRLRAAATTAICYTCSDHPERVERYLSDSRWQVVRNIVFALGQIGGDAVAPMLARAARHVDARVRRAVVQALGQVSPARRVPILVSQLDTPDPQLLSATLAMLLRTADGRATDAILARINAVDFESRPAEARVALLGALADVSDERAIPALEAMLTRGGWFARRTPERSAAADTLARIGTPAALDALRAGLSSRSEAVRAACHEALQRRDNAA